MVLHDCFKDIVIELTNCFLYLKNIQIYGIPVIMYFVGIAILGLIIDYVFG